MYPLPTGFADALTRSHTVQTQVDVLVRGQVAGSFTADSTAGVVSGSVTVDGSAQVRRSLQLRIADPTSSVYPHRVGDLLAPPNELKVWQGIAGFPLIPLGVFGISEPDVADDGGVVCDIKGFDRSRKISRRKWTTVFTITAGTLVPDAIRAILADRDPTGPALNSVITNAVTPTIVLGADAGNDPWKDAQDIASAVALELLYDADGVPVLRNLPNPDAGVLAATYAEGEGGLYLGGSRGFSDEPGTNGVIIIGNGSELTAPFRVEVWNTNPQSPTYYDPANPSASVWGPVPDVQTTDLIPDAATALTVATAQLAALGGTVENVTFNGIPNPAHDAGDIVAVQRAALGVNARYVLDSFTLPLGVGAMEAKCRARTV